jgi:hypothetical protein
MKSYIAERCGEREGRGGGRRKEEGGRKEVQGGRWKEEEGGRGGGRREGRREEEGGRNTINRLVLFVVSLQCLKSFSKICTDERGGKEIFPEFSILLSDLRSSMISAIFIH